MKKLKKLYSVLSKKERWIICVSLFFFIISSVYLGVSHYFKNTKEVPAYEGEYVEGMIGQPRLINPILCQTSDIDSDLAALVYSGLLKLNHQGELVNDLAESYEISEDRLTYTFQIKKDIFWHDQEKLSADDIIFTIKTIQNDDFYSPLRASWKGVKIEKVDDYAVRFILKNIYSPFLNNLTVGILPKHLWESFGANNFHQAECNLMPKGAGPYRVEQFIKDKDGKISSMELLANENYYFKTPFIEKLTFKFFKDEDEIISAFNRKELKGINYLSPENKTTIIDLDSVNVYRLNIPRYFAVFFNQTKSKALSDKTVRLALAYAINKNKLIEDVLYNEGNTIETPIPPGILGYTPNTKVYDYALEHANNILEADGWIDSDGDGIREKDDVKIEFTMVSTDGPELSKTAILLQEMWKEIGAEVKIKNVQISELENDYIKSREYEVILFGEILNYDPDPFAFWHSSQKKESGLNLALYDNAEVDKLLEEARQETDQNIRVEKYMKFQEIIIEDIPAVFLYSPNYLYIHNRSVRGVELNNIVVPSNRFNGVEEWYVKTKRVWK